MANQPNEFARLPLDGNGNPINTAYKAITGTVTLATNTATDDVTLPKGTLMIEFWATVAFGFLGIGSASGTEVTCLANQIYKVGCAGTNGTWKAFFDRNVTTPGTVNYILHMGAQV
jgi:hypothetical protein